MASKKVILLGRIALALAVLGWLPVLGYALQRWYDPAGMASSGGSLLFLMYAMPAAILLMCSLFLATLARGTRTAIVAIGLALPGLLLLGLCTGLLLMG